jgi:hypothetical protein
VEQLTMSSPWDQGEMIRTSRDEGDHVVTGITVSAPAHDDPDGDDRFALAFATSDGRTLRLRLPADQLVALGECCLRLAEARRSVTWEDAG